MSIVYRKAKQKDISLLTKVRIKLIEEDSGKLSVQESADLIQGIKEYVNKAMKAGTFFAYMAFDKGALAGTCCINLYSVLPGKKLPNGKNAYLQNMYVEPSYRRMGIGKKLVELAVDEARKKGHSRIELHSTKIGKCLFEQCGFKNDIRTLSYMVSN